MPTSISLLDIILFIPLLLWAIIGFRNGLVKEVLGLVGLVLAVFLTFFLLEDVHALLLNLFESDPSYLPFVAGLLIFLGVILITHLIIYLLTKSLEAVALSGLNRMGGAIFGLLKSSIVISAILLFIAGFGFPSEQTREESYLYGPVIQVAPVTYNVFAAVWPGAENFSDTIKKTVDEHNPLRKLNEKLESDK